MYTLSSRQYVIPAESPGHVGLLRDHNRWENFSEKDAPEHFANIYALFLTRVRSLSNDLVYLSAYEEKELRFMLDALIKAKRIVQQQSDTADS